MAENNNSKKKIIRIFLVVFFACLLVSFCFIYFKHLEKNRINNQNSVNEAIQNETQDSEKLICDRTTRLENDPNIDRALSLINERLTMYGTYKGFFSPQLTNCIKVNIEHIEDNGENETEGYFDPNNPDIKSNYFPITIDDNSNFLADDLSTALLLVHEITHVAQYIDDYNLAIDEKESPSILGALLVKTKSGCLDDEVSAFRNQLMFAITALNEEERKSIDYRIENDDDPHPQLEILKNLRDSFDNVQYDCEKYDSDCISGRINMHIYNVLKDSGAYDEQCSAYSGTYIGE